MGDTPLTFRCAVGAKERIVRRSEDGKRTVVSDGPGHDRIVRTGRSKPIKPGGRRGARTLSSVHEYRCECGHVGWSRHSDILKKPVVTA